MLESRLCQIGDCQICFTAKLFTGGENYARKYDVLCCKISLYDDIFQRVHSTNKNILSLPKCILNHTINSSSRMLTAVNTTQIQPGCYLDNFRLKILKSFQMVSMKLHICPCYMPLGHKWKSGSFSVGSYYNY